MHHWDGNEVSQIITKTEPPTDALHTFQPLIAAFQYYQTTFYVYFIFISIFQKIGIGHYLCLHISLEKHSKFFFNKIRNKVFWPSRHMTFIHRCDVASTLRRPCTDVMCLLGKFAIFLWFFWCLPAVGFC